MDLSTYLSQFNTTSMVVSIAAFMLASYLWILQRRKRSSRRCAMQMPVIKHQIVDLLEQEMNNCLTRERWNYRMRCFSDDSADKQRANDIRTLLKVRD